MVYLPTCTIQIKPMEVNIPYMDPMGYLRQIVDVDRKQVCFFHWQHEGSKVWN